MDDNKVNQDVTARLLHRVCPNLVVDIANDGQEAVEKFSKNLSSGNPYTIVFTDAHMPVMDGFDATRRMRELEKQTNLSAGRGRESSLYTPILGLTADVMDGAVERCLAAGMDQHIPKPIRIADISVILRKHLFKE